jgi:DNA-binding NarL/FixJ family response regulator
VAAGIPVGVVEDHPLYRSAVTRLLDEAPDIVLDVVAESVAQFAAGRRSPDCVVLLDLALPGVRDAAAVMEVVRMGHPVLVLSANAGRSEVLGALAAGARGYLCKSADGEEILAAIRTTAAGNRYVSPAMVPFVLDAARDRNAGPPTVLSEREREVLSRLAAGERDQDIARTLRISVRTVRTYLDRIRDKTGLRRRPALTRYAIEHGVVSYELASGRISA